MIEKDKLFPIPDIPDPIDDDETVRPGGGVAFLIAVFLFASIIFGPAVFNLIFLVMP